MTKRNTLKLSHVEALRMIDRTWTRPHQLAHGQLQKLIRMGLAHVEEPGFPPEPLVVLTNYGRAVLYSCEDQLIRKRRQRVTQRARDLAVAWSERNATSRDRVDAFVARAWEGAKADLEKQP